MAEASGSKPRQRGNAASGTGRGNSGPGTERCLFVALCASVSLGTAAQHMAAHGKKTAQRVFLALIMRPMPSIVNHVE